MILLAWILKSSFNKNKFFLFACHHRSIFNTLTLVYQKRTYPADSQYCDQVHIRFDDNNPAYIHFHSDHGKDYFEISSYIYRRLTRPAYMKWNASSVFLSHHCSVRTQYHLHRIFLKDNLLYIRSFVLQNSMRKYVCARNDGIPVCILSYGAVYLFYMVSLTTDAQYSIDEFLTQLP